MTASAANAAERAVGCRLWCTSWAALYRAGTDVQSPKFLVGALGAAECCVELLRVTSMSDSTSNDSTALECRLAILLLVLPRYEREVRCSFRLLRLPSRMLEVDPTPCRPLLLQLRGAVSGGDSRRPNSARSAAAAVNSAEVAESVLRLKEATESESALLARGKGQ